ncbi:MAG TPA: hypothetical protein VF458_06395 [Ktedonobacteraceae bacterium]
MATMKQVFKEGPNAKAWRGLLIVLAALVVLSVSGDGTVIYIQLMGKVFPEGPLQVACYMGAGANFLLMVVLLVGKFVWFRPGAHEVASWLVTGVELVVAILNMMLAFQMASGPVTGVMAAWAYLAPVSPIFSMCGAIALIMTSTEMRRRHKALEIEEEKDQAERELDLAMHQAQMTTRAQYVQFVAQRLTEELKSPARQQEMALHASGLVTNILSEMSLLHAAPSAPQLSAPQFPNGQTVSAGTGALSSMSYRPAAAPVPPAEMADDESLDQAEEWLAQVNARIEQERARRAEAAAGGQGEPQPHEAAADAAEVPMYSPEDIARLRRIADAAQSRGYDLEKMAGFLGIPRSQLGGASYEEQLVRLALAAQSRGYGLDRLESLLVQPIRSDGGKKK